VAIQIPEPVQEVLEDVIDEVIERRGTTVEVAGRVRTFKEGKRNYFAEAIDGSGEATKLDVDGKYKVMGTEFKGDGFQAMLKKGKKYAYARFDEDGDQGKTKSVKMKKLSKFEGRFDQDFNEDGVIGKASALKAPSELRAGDVLTGEGGRQLYALANQSGDLYASAGDEDVLVIQNFRTGTEGDVLIASSGSDYSLGTVNGSAAIYQGSDPSQGDLVAVLEGVQPANGLHVNFSFV
jgi:hypothetical protein